MANFLLDSTVLIDILRGRTDVTERVEALLDEERHRLGICVINVAEVYAGMLEHEREATERLLSSFHLFAITYTTARQAGELQGRVRRQGRTLDLSDVLIGATAIENDATLLTANVRDFPLPGLQTEHLPSGR